MKNRQDPETPAVAEIAWFAEARPDLDFALALRRAADRAGPRRKVSGTRNAWTSEPSNATRRGPRQ